jgi:NTE family protein
MRGYAVFAGGGVKGAALAGCLQAAQDNTIEFLGFGGTSAGSIVALLAAVGYSGAEICDILVRKNLTELLDDGGTLLHSIGGRLKKAREQFEAGKHFRAGWTARSLISERWHDLGIYQGAALERFLLEMVSGKLPALAANGAPPASAEAITFSWLQEQTGVPLRVVATDVSARAPVVFPRDCGTYGTSAITAVRASACFPFAFRPVMMNGRQLVDGGLTSNLPCFLFADEFRATRIPTFAFDLVSPHDAPGANLWDFAGRTLYSALEASDVLLRGMSDGVVHIPIRTPPGIDTLDFDISRANREFLRSEGYRQTAEFLSNYQPLRHARSVSSELQKQLMVQFGDPKLYEPVLQAIIRDVEEISDAENVRTNVMLLTGRRLIDGRGTRIVVYHAGMENDPDAQLELAEDAGCSGRAWQSRGPAVADLELAAEEPAPWKMTAQDHSLVPQDRRSMISVPIPARTGGLGGGNDTNSPPIGTLSVDSVTPLADTGWLDGDAIHAEIVELLTLWANVVARLLP